MRLDERQRQTVSALLILSAVFFLCPDPAFAADRAAAPAKTGEKVLPKEAAVDTNADGKPDVWQYFDGAGKILKAEMDTNFDGKIDQWVFYENGTMVRSERDSDLDGKVDNWVKY